MSAILKVLQDACAQRGLLITGNDHILIQRLNKWEEQQATSISTPQVKKIQESKTTKTSKTHMTKFPIQKTPHCMLNCKHTTSAFPFARHYKASDYVRDYCKGNINLAADEWVITSSGTKLMTAKVTGSKSGQIIRWVRAKK